MKKYIFIIILIVLGISSCSFDEKIIDSTREHYRVFLFANLDKTDYLYEVSNAEQPTIDKLATINSKKIPFEVRGISFYREHLFFISKNSPIISVYNANSFLHKTDIDLSKYNISPKDIAFHSGGTSAFVISKASKSLIVVNLLTYQAVQELIMPDTIAGITSSGPSIFISIPDQNKTLLIDNQTLKISAFFDTPDYPTKIMVCGDANKICVLSPGNGKYNNLPKTSATAHIIDVVERKLIKSIKLEIKPKILALDFSPQMMTISNKNIAYISDSINLISIDITKNYRLKRYNETPISFLYYSKEFDGLFIAKDNGSFTELIELNPSNGERRLSLILKPSSKLILPIK